MKVKKPIKVLYISPVAERGGAERALYNLVKFHNRKNCQPYLFFLKDGPFVKEISNLGVPVSVYEAGRLRHIWKYLKTIYKIIRYIQNNEIDIVHGNSSMGHIYGGIAAWIARRRKVWFQHTCSQRFDLIDQIATLIPSDVIITNSFYTATLQKKYFPCHKNIIIIYYGIDFSEFNPDTVKGNVVRKKLGIKSTENVVGIVGRIQRWKGHKYFIDAAYRVNKIMPDVKFLIVGDEMFNIEAGYKKELLSMTKDLGLEDLIIFTGFHENVQDYIDAMDILVHASINPEPFGFVICEGMILGKTVIATDAGGPQEIITDPEIGYLYEAGNSLKLAELIVRFLNDPEGMKTIGIKAKKHIHDNFSMDRMINSIENLYSEIVTK